MNRKTIQKIIDELDKEEPRLDYIRGILETLSESLPKELVGSETRTNLRSPSETFTIEKIEVQDEASLLDATARANLDKIGKIQVTTG